MYWWDDSEKLAAPQFTKADLKLVLFLFGPGVLFFLIVFPFLPSSLGSPPPLWFSMPMSVVLILAIFGPAIVYERLARRKSVSEPEKTFVDALALANPLRTFRIRTMPVGRTEYEEAWSEVCKALRECNMDGYDVFAPQSLKDAIDTNQSLLQAPRRRLFGERDVLIAWIAPWIGYGILTSMVILLGLLFYYYATSFTSAIAPSLFGVYISGCMVLGSVLLVSFILAGTWPYRLNLGSIREFKGAEWTHGNAVIYLNVRYGGKGKVNLINAKVIGPQGTATFPFFRGVNSKKFQSLWWYWLSKAAISEPLSAAQSLPSKPPHD